MSKLPERKIPSKFSESFEMNEICTESRVECAEWDGRLDASVSAVRRTEKARAPDDPTDEIRWTQLGDPSKCHVIRYFTHHTNYK